MGLVSKFSEFNKTTGIFTFKPTDPSHIFIYHIKIILKDENQYLPLKSNEYSFTLKVIP